MIVDAHGVKDRSRYACCLDDRITSFIAERFQSARFQLGRAALVWVFLLVGSPPASAAGDPCARFKDADAYNSCLAASGPAFHEGRFKAAPKADGPPGATHAKGRRGRTRRGSPLKTSGGRHSHGRVRIMIYPGQ